MGLFNSDTDECDHTYEQEKELDTFFNPEFVRSDYVYGTSLYNYKMRCTKCGNTYINKEREFEKVPKHKINKAPDDITIRR